MAQRKSRVSLPQITAKTGNKKNRKRQLDAFAIAGKIAPQQKASLRKHRFGEVDEQERSSRKRRHPADEDGLEESDSEQEQQRKKRRQAKPGDDADVEYGSDSEGNEWTVGDVADDDESIDSDEAFGESDDEKFEGFTFRGSSSNTEKRPKRSKEQTGASAAKGVPVEVDLDEVDGDSEDEDEADDFGEDGVDLATMLDQDLGSDEDTSSDDQPEMSEDESLDDEAEDDEDDEDGVRNARLRDFIDDLDAKDGNKRADIANNQNEETALSLDDLLKGADLDKDTLAALKPSTKSSKPSQLVTAPLPRRQQDAIDRTIANEKAKEQLGRWQDTVIKNRRAEFLKFPLYDPTLGAKNSTNAFTQTQQEKPANDLEESIQKIMEESGMLSKSKAKDALDSGEHDLLLAEELATKQMPVDEVLRRRAELRRHRALLFREEIRAKRIAKIKSKAYRRVHRKERERQADKERMLMDPEGYAEGRLDEDEQALADRRRAEARVSTKHRESKWARSLRATDRAVWDDDARQGVAEQARRQEELKRRIAGNEIKDEDRDSDSDLDDGDEPVGRQLLKNLAYTDVEDGEKKGLSAMKFMRNAEERKRKENEEAIAQLEDELEPNVDAVRESDDEQGLGRAIFGPRPTTAAIAPREKRAELEEGFESEDEYHDDEMPRPNKVNATTAAPKQADKPSIERKQRSNQKEPTKVPLGVARSSKGQLETELGSVSAWLAAPVEKRSKLDRKLARQDDKGALIDTRLDENADQEQRNDAVIARIKKKNAKSGASDNQATAKKSSAPEGAEEDESDSEEEAPMLTQAERNAALHARAFAGDDVALQFAVEKNALVESEDEKEVSNHMPGWGTWAGNGLTKSSERAAARAKHHPLYKTKLPGTKAKDRKDADLENVIISERDNRAGKKYLAPILPHQFERREEYERSLRMPIGPEWSTKEVFSRNTRPRVVVKPGTIIEPMLRPLV